ncbi:MAG TPA: hypothetical protein VF390_01915 [Patescibacteria group bacterium]
MSSNLTSSAMQPGLATAYGGVPPTAEKTVSLKKGIVGSNPTPTALGGKN